MFFSHWHHLGIAALAMGACTASQADCYNAAAQRYGVEANLLRAIASQESSGRWDTTVVNSNGSVDRGLMGINSVHLQTLARFGIDARNLYEPCTNVMVGTWLLKQKILKYGYTWTAVGAYHSETPQHGATYQQLVYRKWRELVGRAPAQAGPAPQPQVVAELAAD